MDEKIVNFDKKVKRSKLKDFMKASGEGLDEDSATLKDALPGELYYKVCNTLNIPITENTLSRQSKSQKTNKIAAHSRSSLKMPLLSYRKTLTLHQDLDSDTEVEPPSRKERDKYNNDNVHLRFLRKGVREQVSWDSHYLQPEREEEKGLVKRADDLTDKIINDFCEYMQKLGGDTTSELFTPKVVKDLFQVQFDTHVARSVRVVTRQLVAVPELVAAAAGAPEKSRKAILEREIASDIVSDKGSDKLTAFEKALPALEQKKSPNNGTRKLWRSARHVPRDLVTLKTVWDGITNLRSVKEYCRWMIDHPEFRRPPFLKSLGLFDLSNLNAVLETEYINKPANLKSKVD